MDIVAPGCFGWNGPVQVLFAFLLVVTGDADRSRRTTPDTGSTTSVMKMKTIRSGVHLLEGVRSQNQVRDHTAAAVGNSAFGDQPIAQAERPQPGGICSMTFRPGRRQADACVVD